MQTFTINKAYDVSYIMLFSDLLKLFFIDVYVSFDCYGIWKQISVHQIFYYWEGDYHVFQKQGNTAPTLYKT